MRKAFVLFSIVLFSPLSGLAQTTSWTQLGNLLQARSGHTVTPLSDGTLLIVGGQDGTTYLASAEIFNPQTGSSVPVKNGPLSARTGHTATRLKDGRVLIAGGENAGGLVAICEIYDPTTGAFTQVGALNTPRTKHTASLLFNGKVLIVGGAAPGAALSSVETFDPNANTFTVSPQGLAAARYSHSATAIRDGRVFFAGGYNGANVLGTTEIFDAKTNQFSAGPSLVQPRYGQAAAESEFGSVALFGGNDGMKDLASIEGFVPTSNQMLSLTATLATPRTGATAITIPSNQNILVVGGTSNGSAVAAAELLDPWNLSPQTPYTLGSVGSLQTARLDGGVAGLSGRVVTLGGTNGSGTALNTAEAAAFPTLTSDKPDYQPGDTVYLTGKGFGANEAIQITQDTMGAAPVSAGNATTDATGGFSTSLLLSSTNPSTPFSLTAKGLSSGLVAHASFADCHSISGLTPNPIMRNPNSVTLQVVGNNFTGCGEISDVVYVQGVPLPTTVVSNTEVDGALNSLNFSPGFYSVDVLQTAPTQECNSFGFNFFGSVCTGFTTVNQGHFVFIINGGIQLAIRNPAPSITSLSPHTVNAGGTGFTSTILGSGFLPETQVQIGSSPPLSAAVDSTGTQIIVSVPASSIASPGLVNITVINPTVFGSPNIPDGGTATAQLIVQDITPPVIAAHADVSAEATSAAGATVNYSGPATSDPDDPPGVATCVPAPGSVFSLGTAVVACNAQDAAGNAAAPTSFKVTVLDTTPPALTLPAPITAEATGPSGAAVSFTAMANDLVDGAVAVSCAPASGTTFALGSTAVNCSASDKSGNTATGSFSVTVRDTTPPALTLPANSTKEATGPSGVATTYAASAFDLVDGAVAISCAPASGTTFALGTTTVNCSATDAHGNRATGSFSILVQDTTPPVISGTPLNMTLEATGPSGAVASWTLPTANDLVDGVVVVTCSPMSGSTFPITTTTVSCSATDAHGNKATTSFTVKVQDTTPPKVTCGSADGLWHASDVSIACTASDIVGLANPATDASFSLMTSVPAGSETSNASTNSRSICDLYHNCATAGPIGGNQVDKKGPTITINVPVGGSYTLNQPVAASFSCTDGGSGLASCSGPVSSGSNIDTGTVGSKTFTVTAKDAVGNTTTQTVSYSVMYASGGLCNGDLGHTILQPINADGTSVFKLGSTVPSKFRVCNYNGVSIGTPGVISYYQLVAAGATSGLSVDESVYSNTPDQSFRWDSTALQWIFNQATGKTTNLNQSNAVYVLRIGLNDGTYIQFQYGLK